MFSCDKVFDLLELTQRIADDLSQHDLAFCCRVNKTFFNTFTPHLWHSITIHPNDLTSKFKTPEGRAGLLRNGHFIRVLRAYEAFALEPFVEFGITCTNLVSLHVNHNLDHFTGEAVVSGTREMLSRGRRGSIGAGQRQVFLTGDFTVQVFADPTSASTEAVDIYASTGLSRLSAPVRPGSYDPSAFVLNAAKRLVDGQTYLIAVVERNPKLEFLVVPFEYPSSPPLMKVVEQLLAPKEFYTFPDIYSRGPATKFSLRNTRPGLLDTYRGEETVEGYLHFTEGELRLPDLSHYPKVKKLREGITERVNHDELERIRLADRGLTYLETTYGPPSNATQILMHAPPLKHIVLTRDDSNDHRDEAKRAYESNENAAKTAFLRHAPTLEHFETAMCDFPKEIVQALLCSSPSLRTLKATESNYRHKPSVEVKLDALQVIETPWACYQLELFDFRIRNVQRSDIVITPPDIEIGPFPPHGPLPGPAHPEDQALLAGDILVVQQESHIVQRQVLRQLGQLTQLQNLRLGRSGRGQYAPLYSRLEMRGICTMIIDEYFDHDCLELSLASGLDELAGLKELEELVVSQMAHRIGLAEVQWMVENWPRLRTINGLHYLDRNREMYGDEFSAVDEPEHVRWIRENRPDIEVS
ncbi:hypothetical protein BGZ88_011058 [Linnemannia elongata]|nr:hypothetical protein BGZ88_011058 [Linnemannia elongata]